jgi:hypothetical protein
MRAYYLSEIIGVKSMSQQRFWIGVVSKEHVEKAKQEGFAQVCHGKKAPLQRMQSGDILMYYSPTVKFGEKKAYQCFTALGVVSERLTYQFAMTPEFVPYRRDIHYCQTTDTPIRPLINQLKFIRDKIKWGAAFCFGIIEASVEDFILIATAMQLEKNKIDELLI